MDGRLNSAWRPDAEELRDVFAEEVSRAGGKVQDVFDDSRLLFLRATVERLSGEVRPGDAVRGGVALRTRGADVLVHPYTYRLVCRNGAILARAEGTRAVRRAESWAPGESVAEAIEAVREAIRIACSPAAFGKSLEGMRAAAEVEADRLLNLTAFISRLGSSMGAQILSQVIGAFRGREESTLFGLMNAITSTARDARDPETRWRLEELGGAVAGARLVPGPNRPRSARPIPV
jgi:hypothetical protein